MSGVSNTGLARFWYGSAITDFLASDADDILGKLSRHAGDGRFSDQRDAWLAQIDILHRQLKGIEGWVFFEFNIPRMGRRVDVILVVGSVIIYSVSRLKPMRRLGGSGGGCSMGSSFR